jgi:hypothetical protein
MPFTPELNTTLPPNTALLSNGVTFSLESTGFAQKGIARDANGNILFEGPETASSTFIIFDTLYAALYPFNTVQPTSEWNVIEELDVVDVVAPKPKQTLQEQNEENLQEAADEEVAIEQSQTSTVDAEEIENATPKSLKAFGIAKLPLLLLVLGNKIKNIIVPALVNTINTYLSNFSKEDLCPNPEDIKKIIEIRNNIVDQLNKIANTLDKITLTLTGLSGVITFIEITVKGIDIAKVAAKIAALVNPVLAAALPPLLNTLNSQKQTALIDNQGNSRLTKLQIIVSGAALVTSIISISIKTAVDLIKSIDAALAKCAPNDSNDLIPISKTVQDIATLQAEAENTQNQTTYNGFIIEVETVPYTNTVNRKRALGKNNSGITMIQTELSFTTDDQTLINELKFIIDRDNLKAY